MVEGLDYFVDELDEKYSIFYWDSEEIAIKTGIFLSKRHFLGKTTTE